MHGDKFTLKTSMHQMKGQTIIFISTVKSSLLLLRPVSNKIDVYNNIFYYILLDYLKRNKHG